MMFNRRRTGELERMLIENLITSTTISKKDAPELYKSLSNVYADNYTGKVGKNGSCFTP